MDRWIWIENRDRSFKWGSVRSSVLLNFALPISDLWTLCYILLTSELCTTQSLQNKTKKKRWKPKNKVQIVPRDTHPLTSSKGGAQWPNWHMKKKHYTKRWCSATLFTLDPCALHDFLRTSKLYITHPCTTPKLCMVIRQIICISGVVWRKMLLTSVQI